MHCGVPERLKLRDTPAGDLRLWQASREFLNSVESVFEPDMQVDQWGAAGSVADGVPSNVTLGDDRYAPLLQTLVT